MAEFDRARVPGHMSKGPPCPISGFLVIVANITVIEGTQQAVEIPIAIASVQELFHRNVSSSAELLSFPLVTQQKYHDQKVEKENKEIAEGTGSQKEKRGR